MAPMRDLEIVEPPSDGDRSAASAWRALTRRAFILSALLIAVTFGLDAAEPKVKLTREYDLKAAFLFNFAQFVEWPAEAFVQADTPFVIGVLGQDPFGNSLDEIVADELIHNRKIVIRRYRDVSEITLCHILYISESETPRLDRIFEFLSGKSILTVGETDHFTRRNGMISFLVVQNKLRLRIHLEAATAAKLTISSKLLRQAETMDAKQEN